MGVGAVVLLCGALLVSLACSGGEAPPPDAESTGGRLQVFAVNEPLRYFAERIGGDAVEVHFPAPAGVDPAHWSPDPDTVASYQGADLILLNGAGYAGWVTRATLPRSALVDTTGAVRDRLLARSDGVTHQHGPSGEHTHGAKAFTTWLDPTLASAQAAAVADAFASRRPELADRFARDRAALEADLLDLDARFAEAATALDGAPLIFSHPVYDYLVRRYDLDARSLHWEPDQPPAAREWRRLETIVRRHPARLLVWEAEPLADTVRRAAELGLESVVFAPCGNRCEGDWLDAMRSNAERLAAAAPSEP